MKSRLPAGHDCWQETIVLSDDPKKAEQNPFLFLARDGSPRMVRCGCSIPRTPHNQNTSQIVTRTSADGGYTWSPTKTLPFVAGTFIRNPMVELEDGSWLLPAYQCTPASHSSHVYISRDQGSKWSSHQVPRVGRVHMSVLALGAERLLAFFRSRFADYIYRRSTSKDGGCT